MKRAHLILVAIVAVLVIIIVLQNTAEVKTRILFVSVSMPHAVLLFVTLVVGYALGLLSASGAFKKKADKPKA